MNREELKIKIKEVMMKYPELRRRGICSLETPVKDTDYTFLNDDLNHRDWVYGDVVTKIANVIEFLETVNRTKTIRRKIKSYCYKHVVENVMPCKYVSNGDFIIGAIIAGVKFEVTHAIEPNCYFNLSSRSMFKREKEMQKKYPRQY